MRIVIHPGFHKTGTTSAQALLRENRKELRRHTHFFLKWRFEDVTFASRGYSTWRDAFAREKFRFRLLSFLGELDLNPDKPLLLTSEELAGHLPGRAGIRDYGATADLCEDLADAVRHRFGADADLRFVFTTRAAQPWLRSAWGHHVARSDMTLDWEEYREAFAGAADFAAVLDAVRDRVGGASVVSQSLEDLALMRLGPGKALLDAVGVPLQAQDRLQPVSVRNSALGPASLAECLALNRADMDAKTRDTRKKALVEAAIAAAVG